MSTNKDNLKEQLRELAKRWRKEGEEHWRSLGVTGSYKSVQSQCADQLETALRAAQESPAPEGDKPALNDLDKRFLVIVQEHFELRGRNEANEHWTGMAERMGQINTILAAAPAEGDKRRAPEPITLPGHAPASLEQFCSCTGFPEGQHGPHCYVTRFWKWLEVRGLLAAEAPAIQPGCEYCGKRAEATLQATLAPSAESEAPPVPESASGERDRLDNEVMRIFIRYGEKVDWDIVCDITSLIQREIAEKVEVKP